MTIDEGSREEAMNPVATTREVELANALTLVRERLRAGRGRRRAQNRRN